MTIGFKYTEQKKQVTKAEKWTKEEKIEYAERVKKWRTELKRFKDFNVYYHPDKPEKPYRKKFVNGYFKMVPWQIFNDHISVGKDGETYKIKISDLDRHNSGYEFVGPGTWSKNDSEKEPSLYELLDTKPTTFQAEIPMALKSEFDTWLRKNVESPF